MGVPQFVLLLTSFLYRTAGPVSIVAVMRPHRAFSSAAVTAPFVLAALVGTSSASAQGGRDTARTGNARTTNSQMASGRGFRIVVTPAASGAGTARTGRLLLVVSTDSSGEPREQMSDNDDTQQVFGIDVHDLSAAHPGVFDGGVFGYPRTSLSEVPPGRYRVQAVLHPYEVFHRNDGHTVELPPDQGEGQRWSSTPGSPMSRPQWVRIDPRRPGEVRITLDTTIAPLPEVHDTKYVKH